MCLTTPCKQVAAKRERGKQSNIVVGCLLPPDGKIARKIRSFRARYCLESEDERLPLMLVFGELCVESLVPEQLQEMVRRIAASTVI